MKRNPKKSITITSMHAQFSATPICTTLIVSGAIAM